MDQLVQKSPEEAEQLYHELKDPYSVHQLFLKPSEQKKILLVIVLCQHLDSNLNHVLRVHFVFVILCLPLARLWCLIVSHA